MNARTALGSRLAALGLSFLALGAYCSKAPDSKPVATPPALSAEPDSQVVARLEREARGLAKTDGCTSADRCRAAPVGERPCGGPRTYIVYCARTTDSAGLYRKLAELREAELTLNKKNNAMSTCEFRTPPELAIAGGTCKAR